MLFLHFQTIHFILRIKQHNFRAASFFVYTVFLCIKFFAKAEKYFWPSIIQICMYCFQSSEARFNGYLLLFKINMSRYIFFPLVYCNNSTNWSGIAYLPRYFSQIGKKCSLKYFLHKMICFVLHHLSWVLHWNFLTRKVDS